MLSLLWLKPVYILASHNLSVKLFSETLLNNCHLWVVTQHGQWTNIFEEDVFNEVSQKTVHDTISPNGNGLRN